MAGKTWQPDDSRRTDNRANALQLLRAGMSYSAVARRLNVTPALTRRFALEAGIAQERTEERIGDARALARLARLRQEKIISHAASERFARTLAPSELRELVSELATA
jgi:transposase-like protein